MGAPAPINKGMRCRSWQRVPSPGGRVLRCLKFEYPKRRYQMGFKPGHIPANYGATCVRRKLVYSPWFNKKVWRCAKYGPGVRKRPSAAGRSSLLLFRRPLPPPETKPIFARRPLLPPPPPSRVALLPPPPAFGPVHRRAFMPYSLPGYEQLVIGRTPIKSDIPIPLVRRRETRSTRPAIPSARKTHPAKRFPSLRGRKKKP